MESGWGLLLQPHQGDIPPAWPLLQRPLYLEHGQGGQHPLGRDLGQLHQLVRRQGPVLQGVEEGQLIVGEPLPLPAPGDKLPAGYFLQGGISAALFLPILGQTVQPGLRGLWRQRGGGRQPPGEAGPILG